MLVEVKGNGAAAEEEPAVDGVSSLEAPLKEKEAAEEQIKPKSVPAKVDEPVDPKPAVEPEPKTPPKTSGDGVLGKRSYSQTGTEKQEKAKTPEKVEHQPELV